MFTSRERGGTFFSQPNVDSSPFLDNFPGVTFAGIFSRKDFGHGDFIPYAKDSEQKSVQCEAHTLGVFYLIMSYTP